MSHKSPPWPFFPIDTPHVTRGEGAWLICDDGSRILDAAGGAIVSSVGHGRQSVIDAMAKATPAYVVPLWRTPEREALVARLTSGWLPPHLTRSHFTCFGGTEYPTLRCRLWSKRCRTRISISSSSAILRHFTPSMTIIT